MSNKGFPSQDMQGRIIPPYAADECRSESQFQTAQQSFSKKVLTDQTMNGVFRLTGVVSVTEAGSEDFKRVIKCTAHGASPHDMIRFELTSANPGFEAQVISTPDADTLILAANLDVNYVVGDEFYILRYVSVQLGQDGTITVSSGPIQFVLDGVTVTVNEDTITPANSRPLPVALFGLDGERKDVANDFGATGGSIRAAAILGNSTGEVSYGSGPQNGQTIRVTPAVSGPGVSDSVRVDYAITNDVSGAWTQIIAATSQDARSLTIFDSGGYTFELGYGPAAGETRLLLIPPGGLNGPIPMAIPSGTRISMRAIGIATVAAGELVLNLLG